MNEHQKQNINIGLGIKQSRKSSGLTQEQLAEQIDISPQYNTFHIYSTNFK